ncbi:hypothetical protein [Spirosoma fluminis]
MNLLSLSILLTVGLLMATCQFANHRSETAPHMSRRIDTLAITEDRLRAGHPIKAAQLPITQEDAAGVAGSAVFTYKADTLATTETAYALLVGRLYAEESIGWLVTIDRASGRQLDKRIAYYTNAEGMTETESKWLPAEQRLLVETGTYDDAGQYKRRTIHYQFTPDGRLLPR